MEKVDARSLKPDAQELLRKQAIRLRKQGKTQQQVTNIVGVSRNTVWKWCKKYQETGARALSAGKRGRKTGTKRLLSSDQETDIKLASQDWVGFERFHTDWWG